MNVGTDKPFMVAGLDGSDQSIRACRWAIKHAKLLGNAVHVVGTWRVPATIIITPTYVEQDYADDARRAFDEALAKTLEGLDAGDVEPFFIRGHARPVLLEAAEGATSLVIGPHGRGNTTPGMHLGSTASYLIHHAPCPVVVVRGESAD
jgi:nucleotide-binding universal stress UspA family protein